MDAVDEAIQNLSTRSANLRCSDLIAVLKAVGFEVKASRRKPNHYTVKHRGLKGFIGSNFASGHGHDAQVKPYYLNSMRRLIEQWEEELRRLLEQRR